MKKSVIMWFGKRKNMALKMITNKIFSIEKIYFDYSILKNWIPQNQKKRLHKHFEGLAALSTHSVGRRVAVKAGCKPVHFSLDGYPLSCYFSGSVATTSGHFVHKSERRTMNGGFHIRPVCCWNQTCAYGSTPHKHSPVFLPLQMSLPSPAATAFSRQRRQSV